MRQEGEEKGGRGSERVVVEGRAMLDFRLRLVVEERGEGEEYLVGRGGSLCEVL